MRKLTHEENAQADACDREKVRNLYPWMNSTEGDVSPDGRKLESDQLYHILKTAKIEAKERKK